jgi:hypothetical protein
MLLDEHPLASDGEHRRENRDHRLGWMVRSGGIEVVLAGLRDRTSRFPWPEADLRPAGDAP